MKTYLLNYQPETLQALEKLRETCPKTIALRDAEAGFRLGEPLLIIADQCVMYAKAYAKSFEWKIGDDFMACPDFIRLITGFRGLLNLDGAAKWEGNLPHDTKDNGLIESLFWTACEIAGIDGNEIV